MAYLTTDQIRITVNDSTFYQSAQTKLIPKNSNKQYFVMSQYELDIITNGTAKLTINNTPYLFEPGSICFRKPGQIIHFDEHFHYDCYNVSFSVYKKESGELIHKLKSCSCFLDNIPDYCEPKNHSALLQAAVAIEHPGQLYLEVETLKQNILIDQMIFELFALSQKENDYSGNIHPAVKRAITYFSNHLDTDIPMKDAAEHVGLSEKYFQRVFKQSTGQTPNAFCMQLRLETAIQKLLSSNQPISEIAYESGFSSSAYFNYVFKKYYQQTPSEYRLYAAQKKTAEKK